MSDERGIAFLGRIVGVKSSHDLRLIGRAGIFLTAILGGLLTLGGNSIANKWTQVNENSRSIAEYRVPMEQAARAHHRELDIVERLALVELGMEHLADGQDKILKQLDKVDGSAEEEPDQLSQLGPVATPEAIQWN